MGATAADNEDFIKLIKKYPIIAINGCDSGYVDSILEREKELTLKNQLMYENIK